MYRSNNVTVPNRTRRRRPRRSRAQRSARRRRNAPRQRVELSLPLEGKKPVQRVVTGSPFADRMIVRQVMEGTISTSTVAFTDSTISGNSAFDPFQAFSGGQPSGFDQWAAIYNEYRVLRSRITVSLIGCDPSTSTTELNFRIQLAACPKNALGAVSSMDDLKSTQYSTQALDQSTGSPVVLRTPWMSTAKFFGYSSAEFDYDGSAAITANPVDEWFWHIGTQVDQKAGTGNTQLDYKVRWEADVEFFVRDTLGLSLEQRLANNRMAREAYLKLKEQTPGKTGRLPPKKTYLESLAESLELPEMDTVLVRQNAIRHELKTPGKAEQKSPFTFGKPAK